MLPAWNDANYGNDQLYPVYQGIGQAREFSPALRSSNRYFLNEDGNSQTIFAVAKYVTKNAGPASSDVVFAFANTNRDASPSGNYRVNQDTDSNGVNDYGIKTGRTYNVRNIAAYEGIDGTRREVCLWGGGRSGADILTNGVFVSMNKVPTMSTSMNPADPAWNQRPYEAQYLKVFDVTAPPNAPGALNPGNAYSYTIGSTLNLTWTPAAPDSEGLQPRYKVNYVFSGQPANFFYSNDPSATFGSAPGSTIQVWVQSVNPNDNSVVGASTATFQFTFLDGNSDNDGDGMSNAREDVAGTNPFDQQSVFAIASVARPDPSTFSVSWTSVPGRRYQVEGATTPGGTYMSIGGVITADATMETLAFAPTGGQQFFRVRIVP